jgi:plastocyanin domain-containing protein
MTSIEWAVVLSGVVLIGWINWYFFLAERASVTAVAGASGIQEITIGVRGGYDPADVRVKKGVPVRLIFDRQETSGCSEEVVFPDFGIKRFLPAYEKTAIEFTPERAGVYEFTCGMSMLRGKVTVEEGTV